MGEECEKENVELAKEILLHLFFNFFFPPLYFLSPQAFREAGSDGMGTQEKHQIGKIEANQARRL